MYRILLADDSKTTQKVLRLSLPEEEFHLECFEAAEPAAAHLGRFGADVVLVDVGLPGGGGYAFCRKLKSDLDTSPIPVVLLAGSLEPIDAERMTWAGADASLTKPFETSRLVDLLEAMARRRMSPPAGSVEIAAEEEVSVPAEQVRDEYSGLVFELSAEECRPRFRILPAREWRRPAAPALTEEQFQAILNAVSDQLPKTLRELLPGLTGEILRRQNS